MTTPSSSGRSWQRTTESDARAFLKRISAHPAMTAGLALLVLVFGGVSVSQWTRAERLDRQLHEAPADPTVAAKADVEALIAEVGRLIALPADEDPTVATVADPSQLKDQPFFAAAKQGDRLLIYPKAGKAVLYDPVAKKIVEVGPVSAGAATTPEVHADAKKR